MVVTAVTTTMATGLTSTTTLKFASTAVLSNMAATAVTTTMATVLTSMVLAEIAASTAVLSNMAATAVTTTMATVLTFTENWVP